MGRPFNTSTRLGLWMVERGYSVRKLEHDTDISYRVISDYLAGRKVISPGHLRAIARVLQVEPEDLQPPD